MKEPQTTPSKTAFPTDALLNWYDDHHRALPWRENQNPYSVWISEIMCQQTRVATVVPYYHRWMKAFPTVEALARSSEDDVFRLWQGLGYYSRARNLRRAAQHLVDELSGQFPATSEGLAQLPGIGRYTAAAIASIAFEELIGVVDGNVLRVLARFYAIHDDLRVAKNTNQFWPLSKAAVDPARPGDTNQAVMELGALVCTPKNPKCPECPIRPSCAAHREGVTEILPFKSPKPKARNEHRFAFRIARPDGALLLGRNAAGTLLGGMWQFPMVVADEAPEAVFAAHAAEHPGALQRFAPVLHVFSHIRMQVTLVSGELDGLTSFRGYDEVAWLQPNELAELGTSKLMKKLLARFEDGQGELAL